jgi:hypothetical protein
MARASQRRAMFQEQSQQAQQPRRADGANGADA